MVVIRFPRSRRRPLRPPPPGNPLGVTVEAALKVHSAIVNGLRLGDFDDHPSGPQLALSEALADLFGPGGVAWAEVQFEILYGVDPYTFSDHIATYRPGGPRGR
jgi:hypothetical protein